MASGVMGSGVMASYEAFKVERRADGVAVVLMDLPGESMNTLNAKFAPEFQRLLDELERDASVKAIVFGSAKKDFIAGADVKMLEAV
ncbi:MAG: enoyl-CoA hydratase-related protein, partial [Sandaracinaceae bacterium]